MGTYIDLYCENSKEIHIERQQEFEKKLEKIFQEGGMMQREEVVLFGKRIHVLSPVQIEKTGVRFWYNYWEECCWETAGYEPEVGVYSSKVGWSAFCKVMEAAYVLQTLYMKQKSWVLTNGDVTPVKWYLSWFDYLFHEKYRLKNKDLMELKAMLHEKESDEDIFLFNWEELWDSGYWMEGLIDCLAVTNGTRSALNWFEGVEQQKENNNFNYIDSLFGINTSLDKFKEQSKLPEDQQIELLINALWEVVKADKFKVGKQDELAVFRIHLQITGNVAFATKKIAELYNRDFWMLYKPFTKHPRKRGLGKVLDELQDSFIKEVTTAELFGIKPDDMIFLWKKNEKIQFSEDLNEWFENLKKQYNEYIAQPKCIEKPIRYMIDILSEIEGQYGVQAFRNWWEGSMDHSTECEYQALWRILENILGDTDIEKKTKTVMLKRFLELVGNIELRQEVFGV